MYLPLVDAFFLFFFLRGESFRDLVAAQASTAAPPSTGLRGAPREELEALADSWAAEELALVEAAGAARGRRAALRANAGTDPAELVEATAVVDRLQREQVRAPAL